MKFLKIALFTSFIFIFSHAHAGGPYFPNGTWKGAGSCKTPNGLGVASYSITLKISDWNLELLQTGPGKDASSKEVKLAMKDLGYGIFEVSENHKKIGNGYSGETNQFDLKRVSGRQQWSFSFDEKKKDLKLVRYFAEGKLPTVCEDSLSFQ